MTRVIYTGMDVHKDTYSLCSYDAQDNVMFSETTVKAETTSVLSYIKSIEKRYSNDDVMIVCGYEAGPTAEYVNIVVGFFDINYATSTRD